MPTIDAAFIPGTDGRECGECVSSGVACSCANDPKAQWWAQGGTHTFSGNIVIPTPGQERHCITVSISCVIFFRRIFGIDA